MNDATSPKCIHSGRGAGSIISRLWSQRFGGLGVVTGAIGLVLIAAPAVVQAAGNDGIMEFFRDLVEPRPTLVQPQIQPIQPAQRPAAPFARIHRPEPSAVTPSASRPSARIVRQERVGAEPRQQKVAVRTREENDHAGGRVSNASLASTGSRRSICVRMCDGYFFPIGDLDSGDHDAHEALCQASCAGAPVKLFTLAAGVEQIEQATAKDGKSYGKLPVAFAYQRERDNSCGCKGAVPGAKGSYVSYLRDFTLRAGDTVVTPEGAKVFKGAGRWPYKESDFTDFRTASALSKGDRGSIDGVLGVSEGERSLRGFKRRNASEIQASVPASSDSAKFASR